MRSLPEFADFQRLWERAGRGLLFAPECCTRLGVLFAALFESSAPGRLGLLLEILGQLAGLTDESAHELSSLDLVVHADSRHQAGIERVIRRVLEAYVQPLVFEDLLKLAGMSKATFARQFPRYTGVTFTEFLTRVRLDHARQRIVVGGESISAAAFGVGFNHLSHFNRLYRRRFGATPRSDRVRCEAA